MHSYCSFVACIFVAALFLTGIYSTTVLRGRNTDLFPSSDQHMPSMVEALAVRVPITKEQRPKFRKIRSISDSQCPDSCSCITGYSVDCNNRNLNYVPNISPDIKTLNLEGNKLTQLTDYVFVRNASRTKLRILTLKSNKIATISILAFARLDKLSVLDLSYNEIRHPSHDIFKTIPRLSQLHLGHNTHLETIPESLKHLRKLTYLDISHTGTKDALSRGQSSSMFTNLDNLASLELSRNDLVEVNLQSIFAGLKKISLTSLGLGWNHFPPDVRDNVFLNLNDTITHLGLQHCGIVRLEQKVFSPLSNIQYLFLSGNKMNILSQQTFATLKRLLYIDLSDNPIKTIRYSSLPFFRSTEWLVLSQMPTVSLNRSQIVWVNSATLSKLLAPNDMKKTIGRENHIKVNFFQGLTKIREINLSGQTIFILKSGTFSNIRTLASLNLSRNEMYNIEDQTFVNLPNLAKLDLSKNNLTSTPCLHSLAAIQQIFLDENSIETINLCTFDTGSSLKVLSLNSNRIRKLPSEMGKRLIHLEVLDLAHNSISIMERNMLESLKALKRLHLSHNLLVCNCHLFGFRRWLNVTHVIILNLKTKGEYKCVAPDSMKNLDLLDYNPDEESCKSHIPHQQLVALGAGIIVAVIIFVVSAVIIYQYHWRICHLYNRRTKKSYLVLGEDAWDDCEHIDDAELTNEDKVVEQAENSKL